MDKIIEYISSAIEAIFSSDLPLTFKVFIIAICSIIISIFVLKYFEGLKRKRAIYEVEKHYEINKKYLEFKKQISPKETHEQINKDTAEKLDYFIRKYYKTFESQGILKKIKNIFSWPDVFESKILQFVFYMTFLFAVMMIPYGIREEKSMTRTILLPLVYLTPAILARVFISRATKIKFTNKMHLLQKFFLIYRPYNIKGWLLRIPYYFLFFLTAKIGYNYICHNLEEQTVAISLYYWIGTIIAIIGLSLIPIIFLRYFVVRIDDKSIRSRESSAEEEHNDKI